MIRLKHVHIIVATGVWAQDGLRYRRHRLAGFLQKQQETEKVIWLCPTPDRTLSGFTGLPGGILQFAVPDPFPQKAFRFCRFLSFYYKKKLSALHAMLERFRGHAHVFLWFTCPLFPEVMNLYAWDKVIYDCSDFWAAPISGKMSLPYRLRSILISHAERKIISRADLIFCTSDYLRNQVTQRVQPDKCTRVRTYENGVDYSLFTQSSVAAGHVLPEHFTGPVLGYIGGIKPKLDFRLIQDAARKRRDWLFLFVGPDGTGEDPAFRELLQEKNVIWTGSVSPAEVPKYMKLVDVGIMPYKLSPYNAAVFPLKLFEFLAAGKPAVGINLPSTAAYAADSVYAEIDRSDTDTFIHVCEEMLRGKDDPDLKARRTRLAKSRDWDAIFQKMANQL
ncbi:glycosyltransferase [Sporolactobacillus sp. THM19-2]|uniref:teichuronic acid biosynthesis protein TuaH n=1 Tax=Sporolactobacillus sp. THM19-2 TaxID=2511171 RepID=UPI0010215B65|nr:glycosyltransferase [Sporolactobacillus sp. THM19-2]RYL89271.1 glycosyltransferase family 1 protein [Sporolactobacillus sp. THM19-2]